MSEIEMSKPEDLFHDPQMLAMAKGEVELPSTKSVRELREKLHKKVLNMDQLTPEEVEKVNTFSRLDVVKDKMREFIDKCHDQEAIDTFDLLAMDWVYSDCLEWDGSIADKYMKEKM